MTRKDYIVIAEGLRLAYLNAKNEMSLRDINGVGLAADCVANALQRDNARFSREHFLAVVRGEKDLHSRPSRKGGAS
jgi:hypothetical protein